MTGKLKQPNWVWVPSVALSDLIREIVRQWDRIVMPPDMELTGQPLSNTVYNSSEAKHD